MSNTTTHPVVAAAPSEPEGTRTQLVHELHDNIIPTLVSAELRLAAASKVPGDPQAASDLSVAADLLRTAVADLVDFIEKLRPTDVAPDELKETLATVVARFVRDGQTTAHFFADAGEPDIAPATCRQLVRIAQEALTNVRRHSGASHAVVRLRNQHGAWRLSIQDNGRGFPFEGVWRLDALDRDRRGPVVIKERVHAIGADLVVESTPGAGASIEVIVAKARYA